MAQMHIWLDDIRPHLIGYLPVKTAPECIRVMQRLGVDGINRMSLDHDLGVCAACGGEGKMVVTDVGYQSCAHNGTGYDVVLWMEEHDFWPARKPDVHSANPVGRQRMQAAINRAYERKEPR